MMRHLPFIISIIAGLSWLLAFRLSSRFLGISWPPGFQQREGVLRRLSFNQYVCLLGALGWGVAMFVASVANDYLQGKLLGDLAFHPSAAWITFELVLWLAGGCLFGWLLWGGSRQS